MRILLTIFFLANAALAQDSFRYNCPKGDAVLPASCLEDMRIANVNRQLSSSERHQLAYLFAKSYVVSIVKYEQDYNVDHEAPISKLLLVNFPNFKSKLKEGGVWLRDVFHFFRSDPLHKADAEKSLRGLSAKQRQRVLR